MTLTKSRKFTTFWCHVAKKPAPKKAKPKVETPAYARAAYDKDRHLAEIAAKLNAAPPDPGKMAGKRCRELEDLVLGWIAKGYSKSKAAAECGLYRKTIDDWMDVSADKPKPENVDFAARFKVAYESGTEFYLDEARRRAVDGVDKPVFQQGMLVGMTREYSDALMSMHLKARAPGYNDKTTIQGTGKDGAIKLEPLEVVFVQPGEKT